MQICSLLILIKKLHSSSYLKFYSYSFFIYSFLMLPVTPKKINFISIKHISISETVKKKIYTSMLANYDLLSPAARLSFWWSSGLWLRCLRLFFRCWIFGLVVCIALSMKATADSHRVFPGFVWSMFLVLLCSIVSLPWPSIERLMDMGSIVNDSSSLEVMLWRKDEISMLIDWCSLN